MRKILFFALTMFLWVGCSQENQTEQSSLEPSTKKNEDIKTYDMNSVKEIITKMDKQYKDAKSRYGKETSELEVRLSILGQSFTFNNTEETTYKERFDLNQSYQNKKVTNQSDEGIETTTTETYSVNGFNYTKSLTDTSWTKSSQEKKADFSMNSIQLEDLVSDQGMENISIEEDADLYKITLKKEIFRRAIFEKVLLPDLKKTFQEEANLTQLQLQFDQTQLLDGKLEFIIKKNNYQLQNWSINGDFTIPSPTGSLNAQFKLEGEILGELTSPIQLPKEIQM